MNKCKTAILLATYNSERFLREQLESLYAQTCLDWTLYVHDDGSTDSTISILEEFSKTKGNLVILDYPPLGSAKDNFISILQHVDADYYFFCDHDDVWLSFKVEYTLDAVIRAENNDTEKPVVAYTDLSVVDEHLCTIHPSMWAYQGLHPERICSFDDFAAQVPATGCTMCFNNAAKIALQTPLAKAKMHDAWLLLCAVKAGGNAIPLSRVTVLYRQHGGNIEGTQSKWKRLSLLSLLTFYHRNSESYRMLAALGYGSLWKYMYHKFIFYLK